MTADNATYYDAFSARYDHGRDRGYHELIDDQAAAIVQRVAQGRHVLEVGCGTGLVMERVARFASRVQGIDLSPGMLQRARARGLEVQEGSATALPFEDGELDVVYSFKVLAHVEPVELALREMARVTRPGGYVVFDAYNRDSLRFLIKRAFGPRRTSGAFDEGAISTRFDAPAVARARAQALGRVVDEAGIRIVTAHPGILRIPGVATATARAEWALMRSPLRRFAGFVVFTVQRGP